MPHTTWLEVLDLGIESGVLVETLEQQYDRVAKLTITDEGKKMLADPTLLRSTFDYAISANSPIINYAPNNGDVKKDYFDIPHNEKSTIGAIEK